MCGFSRGRRLGLCGRPLRLPSSTSERLGANRRALARSAWPRYREPGAQMSSPLDKRALPGANRWGQFRKAI